ncbi:MAG: hypothetical protein L0287_35855, partial [Anaerolineae bacterium]|nr:hypothetical protein [Anaerolineae bacterium]
MVIALQARGCENSCVEVFRFDAMRFIRAENNGNWALPASEKVLRRALDRGLNPDVFDIVLVQHLLPDTAHYVRVLLTLGFNVTAVFGIEYSTKRVAVDLVKNLGIEVHTPTSGALTGALKGFLESRRNTMPDKYWRPLLLQDVGGYASGLLGSDPKLLSDLCKGIVEETRQGLWLYQDLDTYAVPVVEIASTNLKRIESVYVGQAVARALESDLLVLGNTLAGLPITVLGFGDVGCGCAHAIRNHGGMVAIYDPDSTRTVEAVAAGFLVLGRDEALRHGRVLVGATGRRSVEIADLAKLKAGTLLASASSKQVEFPVREIASISCRA